MALMYPVPGSTMAIVPTAESVGATRSETASGPPSGLSAQRRGDRQAAASQIARRSSGVSPSSCISWISCTT